MFIVVRMLFLSIILIISFITIQKSKIINKRRGYIIVIYIIVILGVISNLIPIENAFITFHTPQKSFNYVNNADAILIINGNKTDLVIGRDKDTDISLIIPKNDDGWKLGMGLDTEIKIQKIYQGIVIYVYQYRDSNEYYISVFDTNGGEIKVTDNNNSKFYKVERIDDNLNKTFSTYYSYVENLDKNYSLIVNGIEIPIVDKKTK